MLLITRRPGEEVIVTLTESLPAGTPMLVKVLSIAGNQARLGFEVARSVTVDRREVHERKLAEKHGARPAYRPRLTAREQALQAQRAGGPTIAHGSGVTGADETYAATGAPVKYPSDTNGGYGTG